MPFQSKSKIVFLLCLLVFVFSACQQTPKNDKSSNKTNNKQEQLSKKTTSQPSSVNNKQLNTANKLIASVGDEAIAKVDFKKIYSVHCIACHGPKGNMSIAGSKALTKSKLDLASIVAQVYHGKGTMVAYKGTLSDAEIVAVSKYVKELQQ